MQRQLVPSVLLQRHDYEERCDFQSSCTNRPSASPSMLARVAQHIFEPACFSCVTSSHNFGRLDVTLTPSGTSGFFIFGGRFGAFSPIFCMDESRDFGILLASVVIRSIGQCVAAPRFARASTQRASLLLLHVS